MVSTFDQALDIAKASGSPAARVVVDTHHAWRDPDLERAIQRAAAKDRLVSYPPHPHGILRPNIHRRASWRF